MKKNFKILISTSLLFLFSCEEDGQITGDVIEPDLPAYVETDMTGNGGDMAYLSDIYYDFTSSQSYSQQFYKFNNYHLSGGNHNPLQDLLDLNTYQSVYYISSESIENSENNSLYIYDSSSDSYQESNYSNISSLELNASQPYAISDSLLLTSTVFSVLDSLTWNSSSNRYSFSTIQADKDTAVYYYTQDYDSVFYSTLVDTVLNNIYSDIVMIDTAEVVNRFYTVFDTIVVNQNSQEFVNPVKIKRSKTFLVNDIYVPNNGAMFRESTDCNNNYQQDDAEFIASDIESMCIESGGVWTYNSDIPCDSYCSNNGTNVSMNEECYNLFSSEPRLTGHCVTNSVQDLTFCDTGNKLYDNSPEVYYDADQSGSWNLSGQDLEPWEDRNCNGVADVSASDIEQLLDSSIAGSQEACESLLGTWDDFLSICFMDKGNGIWDDKESCYTGDGCDYKDLYKRSDAPDILMVDYSDNDNPEVILSAYPDDVFNDCGSDNLCNEEEEGYDYGTCENGFSGNLKDCCKYYLCWDYVNGVCDYGLRDCVFSSGSDIWSENLDPAGDDFGGAGDQTEGNNIWDTGESIVKDFNNDGLYSLGTSITNKTLDYSNCDSDCGGESMFIIQDSLRAISISSFEDKVNSEVRVSSFDVIDQVEVSNGDSNISDYLLNFNIMKTDFINTSGDPDYDYMLFVDSESQSENGAHYIVKMIHPYYFFAPGYWNMGDVFNVSDEDFWSSLQLEKDTLMYSLNGLVIDGQTHYSSYSVESDTANYIVHKEYEVSKSEAITSYSGAIEDCFKVVRTVTTTMLGSGLDFKLKTESYLKEGYPIVKEDVFVLWTAPPWLGDSWVPISSIEFKDSRVSDSGPSSFFSSKEQISLNSLNSNPDFEFKPFKISNTIGLQRVEYPND